MALRDQINSFKDVVDSHSDQLQQVSKAQRELEERFQLLERGSTAAALTVVSDGTSHLTAITGGWPANTHRDVLTKEAAELGAHHRLDQLMDGERFSTGLRRSFVMTNIKPRV